MMKKTSFILVTRKILHLNPACDYITCAQVRLCLVYMSINTVYYRYDVVKHLRVGTISRKVRGGASRWKTSKRYYILRLRSCKDMIFGKRFTIETTTHAVSTDSFFCHGH